MTAMLRIKTKFDEHYYVHTLYYPAMRTWMTFACVAGAVTSFDSDYLYYAGQVHLEHSKRVLTEYQLQLSDQGQT